MKILAILAACGLLCGCACAQIGKMQREERERIKVQLQMRGAQVQGTRLNTAEATVDAGVIHPSRGGNR